MKLSPLAFSTFHKEKENTVSLTILHWPLKPEGHYNIKEIPGGRCGAQTQTQGTRKKLMGGARERQCVSLPLQTLHSLFRSCRPLASTLLLLYTDAHSPARGFEKQKSKATLFCLTAIARPGTNKEIASCSTFHAEGFFPFRSLSLHQVGFCFLFLPLNKKMTGKATTTNLLLSDPNSPFSERSRPATAALNKDAALGAGAQLDFDSLSSLASLMDQFWMEDKSLQESLGLFPGNSIAQATSFGKRK